MNEEVPMAPGAIIVNGDTGEITTVPFTEEQLAERDLVIQRMVDAGIPIEDVIPVG
jgi:hypothetical protein